MAASADVGVDVNHDVFGSTREYITVTRWQFTRSKSHAPDCEDAIEKMVLCFPIETNKRKFVFDQNE
jgi:hypothetical protein